MPENANRRAHLYTHLNQSRGAGVHPALQAALAQHPDWPMCDGRPVRLGQGDVAARMAARCGWPLDPAAAAGGFATHPGCALGEARP